MVVAWIYHQASSPLPCDCHNSSKGFIAWNCKSLMTLPYCKLSQSWSESLLTWSWIGRVCCASSSALLSESRTSSLSLFCASYSAYYACMPVLLSNTLDSGTDDLSISGLILIFIEVPFLLRICPTSSKFDAFIRRFTTNWMRAAMYGVMSVVQWLSLLPGSGASSLIVAAVFLLIASIFYALAGLKSQEFVGSKTLGGQGLVQMIVWRRYSTKSFLRLLGTPETLKRIRCTSERKESRRKEKKTKTITTIIPAVYAPWLWLPQKACTFIPCRIGGCRIRLRLGTLKEQMPISYSFVLHWLNLHVSLLLRGFCPHSWLEGHGVILRVQIYHLIPCYHPGDEWTTLERGGDIRPCVVSEMVSEINRINLQCKSQYPHDKPAADHTLPMGTQTAGLHFSDIEMSLYQQPWRSRSFSLIAPFLKTETKQSILFNQICDCYSGSLLQVSYSGYLCPRTPARTQASALVNLLYIT